MTLYKSSLTFLRLTAMWVYHLLPPPLWPSCLSNYWPSPWSFGPDISLLHIPNLHYPTLRLLPNIHNLTTLVIPLFLPTTSLLGRFWQFLTPSSNALSNPYLISKIPTVSSSLNPSPLLSCPVTCLTTLMSSPNTPMSSYPWLLCHCEVPIQTSSHVPLSHTIPNITTSSSL